MSAEDEAEDLVFLKSGGIIIEQKSFKGPEKYNSSICSLDPFLCLWQSLLGMTEYIFLLICGNESLMAAWMLSALPLLKFFPANAFH